MSTKKSYPAVDIFRLAAAFLVVAVHISPLASVSGTVDFIFTRIIARIAVPFFLMATGFFLLPGFAKGTDFIFGDRLKKFFQKTLLLYGAATAIYLPVNLYAGHLTGASTAADVLKAIVFDGTFYHLWYLPALLIGVPIAALLLAKCRKKTALMAAVLLYALGLLGDSYYGLAQMIPPVRFLYDNVLFHLFGYTRNGLFYAPLFLMMGASLGAAEKRPSRAALGAGLAASFSLMTLEALLLKAARWQRHDSMYVMLPPVMFFLFSLLVSVRGTARPHLRDFSMAVYIVHPLALVMVRGAARAAGLTPVIVENSPVLYLCVCALSAALAFAYTKLPKFKRKTPPMDGRAWMELDGRAIAHNVGELRRIMPQDCRVMAMVKTDAYGHGDVWTARHLETAGVDTFAVAALKEGVRLRKAGIRGDILVLGRTPPQQLGALVRYRLMQTAVDYAYAQQLNTCKKPLCVHVKIDTGMHRFGENGGHMARIRDIYMLPKLKIKGTFTHLCVCDSLTEENQRFTQAQLDNLSHILRRLKDAGHDPGKIHIQSSYGLLNYPDLKCDYARIGIALYGVLSDTVSPSRTAIDLYPVMSIRARISLVRDVKPGDSVSYGRCYVAEEPRRIAVVSIGYGDGLPRSIKGGHVLIHGQKAPYIGRICMDACIVDITGIKDVLPGDVVTVIGRDGEQRVAAEALAQSAGTITNELFTRLSPRLERIHI